VDAGAEVQGQDKDGDSALALAAAYNHNPEVVSVLLKAGADVDAQDKSGSTALMLAVEEGNSPEIIVALLKAGANAKVKDMDGHTALYFAPLNRELQGSDALRWLQVATQTGPQTTTTFAPSSSQTNSFTDLASDGTPQAVQAAIDKGADINAPDEEYGRTPDLGRDQQPES
jgi:hypothetical protein